MPCIGFLRFRYFAAQTCDYFRYKLEKIFCDVILFSSILKVENAQLDQIF